MKIDWDNVATGVIISIGLMVLAWTAYCVYDSRFTTSDAFQYYVEIVE